MKKEPYEQQAVSGIQLHAEWGELLNPELYTLKEMCREAGFFRQEDVPTIAGGVIAQHIYNQIVERPGKHPFANFRIEEKTLESFVKYPF